MAGHGAVDQRALAGPHFESVAAVCRLQVISVFAAQLKHSLDWRGDVLVEPVGKLNYDDGALARGAEKSANDRPPGLTPDFAQDYFHSSKLAYGTLRAKHVRKNPAIMWGLNCEFDSLSHSSGSGRAVHQAWQPGLPPRQNAA